MSKFVIPNGRKSNWETVAFTLIRNLIKPNMQNIFNRSQLMTQKNLDLATVLLKILGHKKHPEKPEQTLQKNLQNLRDKGYLEFLGDGRYKFTNEGCQEIIRLQTVLDGIEGAFKEINLKKIKL